MSKDPFSKSPLGRSPKAKKKNPWSDDSEVEEISDVDSVSDKEDTPVIPRERGPSRRAKGIPLLTSY